MGGRQWIREQKIQCGQDYMTVSLFAIGEQEHKAIRRKKGQESSARQKQKNKMASLRQKQRKILANFDEDGFYITATYEDAFLPEDTEQARREVRNFTRRVQRAVEKIFGVGKSAVRFSLYATKNGENGRWHMHGFAQCDGLSRVQRLLFREMLEKMWRRRVPGSGEYESMGTLNADRLDLKRVLGKAGESRWGTVGYIYAHTARICVESRNLVCPQQLPDADSKWSRKQLRKGCRECEKDPYWWEQRFPGWAVEKILIFEPHEMHEGPEEPGEWEQSEPQAYLILRRRRGYGGPVPGALRKLAQDR